MDDLNTSDFAAGRTTRSYQQTINAAPEVVFPLLCPVREAEWLDGWQYEMIYSESGFAEAGCVFKTPGDVEEDTVWVISKHDKDNRSIDFVRYTPCSRTCVLSIAVIPKDENSSSVAITYTYTGITTEGNAWIDNLTEEKFLNAVKFWERSMNHFLEKGEKLLK